MGVVAESATLGGFTDEILIQETVLVHILEYGYGVVSIGYIFQFNNHRFGGYRSIEPFESIEHVAVFAVVDADHEHAFYLYDAVDDNLAGGRLSAFLLSIANLADQDKGEQ